MSEEPAPEWLPPKAPGGHPPRTWHNVPEPGSGESAPGAPWAESDSGEPAAGGFAAPRPVAGERRDEALGGAPFPTERDARDWWRTDRAGGRSAAASALAPVPVSRSAGNGQALASLLLGIAGLVLFFASGFGLVFVLNLPCSIMAWVFGVQGRRKVARGETTERGGMAQAGMVLGIVGTVIGGLAIIAWALGFLLSDDLRDQFQREWERRQSA
jgi:hypothetical protein